MVKLQKDMVIIWYILSKIVFFPFEYTNVRHTNTLHRDTHLVFMCVCVHTPDGAMGSSPAGPYSTPARPPFNDGPSVTVPTGRVTGLFAGPAGCLWLIGQQIVRGDGHVTAHISIWVKNQANVANSRCMRERERDERGRARPGETAK